MAARVADDKKQQPHSTEAEYSEDGGMPRPISPAMQHQQQYAYGGDATPPPPHTQQQASVTRARPSRISRAFGGGRAERKERKKSGGGIVRKVFGGKKKNRGGGGGDEHGKYGPSAGVDQGGVMYSEDDEIEYDQQEEEEEEEDGNEPQLLHHRRRFVRSGLTTYEQVISKTSAARRFNRRSYMPPPSAYPSMTGHIPSPCKSDSAEYYRGGGASPVKGDASMDKENSPSTRGNAGGGGMSSLSSALQEVINSHPTALRSVVDPSAGPTRVHKSFVVEQTADGNLFVASKRVPSGPTGPPMPATRQTMDDSFIGYNGQTHDQFMPLGVGGDPAMGNQYGHHAGTAVNPSRHSEMDFVYRQKHNLPGAGPSGPPGSAASTAASLLSMSKAGVRRRISGADGTPFAPSFVPLGGDSISHAPTAMATATPPTRLRRSSSSGKLAEMAVVNQMANMFMDHTRERSRSRSADGLQMPVMPLRKDSAAMLLQRGSFEEVDALPLTMDDLFDRKPLADKGPMTFEEFIVEPKPAPPPPPPFLQRKGSNGRSGRKKSTSKSNDDDEDVDNELSRSFRNLKDVDALKRSRSIEDTTPHEEKKVVPALAAEETETEEEYPDYAEERATDDLGSSYEEESSVRTSNITDFLGGFKSRNSMNRNSLGGRNSGMGKNDFVSRAARSLRNSRKAAQETEMVQSELSRKLWEARARVPLDLRGDPPTSTKKRSGFRSKKKSVRFDMTPYVREFEVIEPEVSDDEVNQWSQRDSEQDDEDEDEDEDNSTDDDDSQRFGVPIPGAVLAAAMADASTYYSSAPLAFTNPMRYSAGRVSIEQRYSAVGRPNANGTR